MINRVKRTSATTADLFAGRHRFKDLTLFDLAELAAVGIDPAALAIGEEAPARFYALWQYSAKLTSRGTPYKDVVALEPLGSPATVASTDNSAILAELRAIRALLAAWVEAQGLALPVVDVDEDPDEGAPSAPPPGEPPPGGELQRAFPRYGDGAPVSDNEAELAAFREHVDQVGAAPENLEALRAWVTARRRAGQEQGKGRQNR